MKRGSTHFLRFFIFLIGAVVLALCVFALPSAWKDGSVEFPEASRALLLIVIGLYASTVPFYVALWRTLKLLGLIDRNAAFSDASVRALKDIKRCAIAITVLYAAFVPLLFPIAEADDAPGLVLFGAVFACLPAVVAVFAAVLERLLRNAIDLQAENELTV